MTHDLELTHGHGWILHLFMALKECHWLP